MPRAILGVLDSVGIGGAPDAASYFNGERPDTGANTLLHIAEACAAGKADQAGLRSGPLELPNMATLGLGAAIELSSGQIAPNIPVNSAGCWGVGREVSKGKDTPSGHWEIAGVPVPFDWSYFPNTQPSFPADMIKSIIEEAGLPGILGDKHASGTAIIAEHGEEHVRTGKPIFYTSADSVFQIAAHETHFGLDKLYELCEIVFKHTAPMKIGRVIARPFVGETADSFKRTANRRDFAIEPPEPTILDRNAQAGRQVYAIGKVSDIYAARGVTHKIKAAGNMNLFDRTLEAMDMADDGALIFTNFVDFDQEYGHRRDIAGYAAALEAFDRRLPELVSKMRDDDLLILTADHGNDPSWSGTDHTREQVPILCHARGLPQNGFGLRLSFADIGESIARWLRLAPGPHGTSFL